MLTDDTCPDCGAPEGAPHDPQCPGAEILRLGPKRYVGEGEIGASMRPFLENDLRGWTLENLSISADRKRLTLTVRQPYSERAELAIFDVCADCCSESWIEYAESPELRAAIITGFERLDKGDRFYLGDQEVESDDFDSCRRSYQLLIHTTAGTVSVEFRNDSNGYYGGSLEFTELLPGA